MKHALQLFLIALVSFYAGWLAHGNFIQEQELAQLPTPVKASPLNATTTRKIAPAPQQTRARKARPENFLQLLAAQRFEEAVQFYAHVGASDEQGLPPLRADLIAWLQRALAQGNDEGLTTLADTWLSHYYDDIDVLLILAEYQRRQGYPDEAARTVQFALTYALQTTQQEKVSQFFQNLVEKTDAAFSREKEWIELLGFYQLLESIGLSLPEYQLRQAEISLQLGDFNAARALLMPLTQHLTWADEANDLLALMAPPGESAPTQVAFGEGIPLQRRGGHYLVNAGLNNDAEITLMIDTGASVTSLSQASFAELSKHTFFDYLGWRLFNTANGVTRGNIYRINYLRLGDHILQDVEIAVLNFQQGRDVDGLLGMNVLQHYRFEIDQDREVLLLRER